MSKDPRQIVQQIENFNSATDEEELHQLDEALAQLFASAQPELGIDALLGVFERFPEDDGYGVFWGIVHGLESLSGYEVKLVESVRRRPSEFSPTMVNRLLNAGQTEVGGADLVKVLQDVALDESQPTAIRETAQVFVDG